MKIFVRVKTNSKKQLVERINETHFNVQTKELPKKGRANKAVIKILAKYFNISTSEIRIISGQNKKKKILEINKD